MNNRDLVLIEGLSVEAVIGVYDWEREILQRLIFDLELATDITVSASSDDVSQTLDYKAICDAITAFTKDSSFKLIEALAETVAAHLFNEFPISSLTLKLSKPGAVPGASNVAVKISRSRH